MAENTPQAIILESGLEGLLGNCAAYDLLDSAIAIFDTQASLRYGNSAFMDFIRAVRDSTQNLSRHPTLLDCPQFRSWLQDSVSAGQVKSLRQAFFYSPRIQVELTVYARPVVTTVAKSLGILVTLGEESIEFGGRHIARSQESLLTFANRIKVLDRDKINNDRLIRVLLTDAPFAMVLFNSKRQIVQVNRAAELMFGISASKLIGQSCEMLLPCYEQCGACPAIDLHRKIDTEEINGQKLNNESIPLLRSVATIHDDVRGSLVIEAFMDLTERNKADEMIHNLAFYDPLTNLPNRRLLKDRLQQAMASSTRNQQHVALLFLDLDNFKNLNDTLGHDIGDLLLIEVTKRLQTCMREGDTIARFGGDEFVLILEQLDEDKTDAAAQAEMVGEKIRMVLGQPCKLNGLEHHCSASIGINLFIDHPGNTDELLKQADVAMYQAKQAGRNTIRFFDPVMQAVLDARGKMEMALRGALANRQFCLHYQVQVDEEYQPIGAEALLRWNHPDLGMVPPVEFIQLAEENGMIQQIGLWVLETACKQLRLWQGNPLFSQLNVAVNVSKHQFRQGDFVAQVKAVLEKSGIKPNRLKLELTESLLLNNVEDSISKMQQLKSIGVDFSMDDFGTGYSSLSYLKRLPLDQIKIDQSFVHDISTNPNDAAIVQTIIAMASTLGLRVLAEGVETEVQRKFLESSGCLAFQGYLFGKAMPAETFEALLVKMRNGNFKH
jgi:diguanylate cyclase (GGDEF)-like protein/PAS domain S-box-containing protein